MSKTTRELCKEVIEDLRYAQRHCHDIVESIHDFNKSIGLRLLDSGNDKALLECLMDGKDAINKAVWDDEDIKGCILCKIGAHIERQGAT